MNWLKIFGISGKRELQKLESRLDEAFPPIGPNPQFVSRLRQQLTTPASRGWLGLSKARWQMGAALVGVLVGTVLLFQNSLRLALWLLSILGIVQQVKKTDSPDTPAPMKPAT